MSGLLLGSLNCAGTFWEWSNYRFYLWIYVMIRVISAPSLCTVPLFSSLEYDMVYISGHFTSWNMIWYTFLGILHHCNYLLLFRNCNYWMLVSVSCVCLYVHSIPGLILIYFWDQGDVLYVAFIRLTSKPVVTFFCYSFETGKEQTNMAACWDQIQNEKVLHYGTIQSLQMEVHNYSVYSYKPTCIFSWCPL